ncbi:hypothetical protein [Mycolicibacterium sp. A43C]
MAPAFFPLPSKWLRGELFAAPNTTVKLPYNNFPATANVHKGADLLNDLLYSTAGHKIVLGPSERAQVQDDWLRRYGPTSDIAPATVQFILAGDPEHRFNGCTRVPAPTPTNPNNQVHIDRNVKYVLGSPATYYLPMVTQKWISLAQKQAQDLELRPQVELNYGRRMGSPTPPTS